VARCRTGDLQAFEALFRRYHQEVYRVAYRVLRHRDDALDTAQEAFVRAFRRLDRYDGRGSFAGWVRRIAVNLAVDGIRRRPRVEAGALAVREGDPPGSLLVPAPGPGPDGVAESRELALALQEALANLPPIHRAAIVLKEIEGMSCQAIADTLDCSVGTVMSRLHYARRKLQRHLRRYRA
jgi:RNA polymerase sigma-70 factor, ECF subfamily